MNYQEAIDFMFSSLPMYQRVGKAAYKANLDNTLALDEHFGHPHRTFKTIHVAGTNGKGSVSHSLAAILQSAGYKTGLYTSPHLVDYRERIRVNGEMISKDYVCDFINQNQEIIGSLKPSFFEMSVALAFNYFRDMKVDVAVIEVGMGGRLDSTNIITPELSVITNISFDHTQFLGNTLPLIAGEKAGIIKHNIPVVIGETHPETKPVFKAKAKEQESPITFADKEIKVEKIKVADNHKYAEYLINGTENLNFDLFGEYQTKNLATILEAAKQLKKQGFAISDENISEALQNVKRLTGLHGRWEILAESPLTICDTGHNVDGLSYVTAQLKAIKCPKLHIVLGFVNDKDVEHVMPLFPKDAQYYFTQAEIPRAMPAEQVKAFGEKFGLTGKTYENVPSAYESAKKNASSNDAIFIGGSTFIVGDYFKHYGFQ
ncbi:MAG: bifunctional folylpolyglutamate synthase/dihydrofolate synthase [Bacteroidales bacterium]|nr:bifunctional folylpolyglutamate synthase/dihydrofolate synthase [Bacteroidales bacterium]